MRKTSGDLMSPITAYSGFLSPAEVDRAKQQVFAMREHWHDPTPEKHAARGAKGKFVLLGSSLYRMNSLSDLNLPLKALMLEEFAWLYERLFDVLGRTTGRSCKFRKDLPVPGFHISELDITPTPLEMHIDNRIGEHTGGLTSVALISLLDAGSQGAWLEYLDGDTERKLVYEKGVLYAWGPTLLHRIGAGSLQVKPGESRMTLQGHFFVDPDDNKNVLFF